MEPKGFPRRESPAPAYPTAELNTAQNEDYNHPQPPPPYSAGFMPLPQHTTQPTISQPPPTQNTSYVVQQIYTTRLVGPDPSAIVCPSCHQHIVTRLDYETTTKTHLMAALLCLFVCWPCAFIPYCMDTCKNANHYCPNCGAFIGTHKT